MAMMRGRNVGLFGALIVAAGAVLASSAPALAQGGRGGGPGGGFGAIFGGGAGGMAQAFEPSITSQDLDRFSALLALDATQKDAAKDLFEAYQRQFTSSAKVVRDKVDAAREEARDGGDPSAWRDVMTQVQDFRKQRDQMEASFLGDLKTLLTEDQTTRWPKLERMRRREQTITRGMMSGERVDMFKLVEELKLPADAQKPIAPVLDEYEVELDRELVARNAIYDEMQTKAQEIFRDRERMRQIMAGEDAEADKMFKKGRDASLKVRDINRKFAARIEGMLPADVQPTFGSALQRESFPQIYRQTYANRVVDAAAKMEGLDEGQKQGIAALRETFVRDLGVVQKDMAAATEEQEVNMSLEKMMESFGGGGEGKLADLRRKRRDMERDVIEKVRALLTEEQKAKLPERDERAEGGRGAQPVEPANPARERRRGGGAPTDRN